MRRCESPYNKQSSVKTEDKPMFPLCKRRDIVVSSGMTLHVFHFTQVK